MKYVVVFQFEKEYERAYPQTSQHLVQKWGAVSEDIIQYTTQMMPNWMDELGLGDSDAIELEKLTEGRVLICCSCPTLALSIDCNKNSTGSYATLFFVCLFVFAMLS